MKFKIKNVIGITAILFSQIIAAQVYIGIQSGVSDIQSNVVETVAKNHVGGAVKAGYIYQITNNIGIGSGVEFSLYRQEVALIQSSSSLTNYEVDASGSSFVYSVTTNNYKEKQTLQAIQIPLFLQFKMNINKGIDFNFRAGTKYFLPVSYKFKATADNVAGSAYYPDYNLLIDNLPDYGFGGQSNYSANGEYETKGIFMSSFEIGFTFDMGKKNTLYAAMFFEKGLNSVIDQDNDKSYIGYNPTSNKDRKANGIYSTNKNAGIKPLAFGVTLEWNFKW